MRSREAVARTAGGGRAVVPDWQQGRRGQRLLALPPVAAAAQRSARPCDGGSAPTATRCGA